MVRKIHGGAALGGLIQANAVLSARPPAGGVCTGVPTLLSPLGAAGGGGARMHTQAIPKVQQLEADQGCTPQVGALWQAGVSRALITSLEQVGKTAVWHSVYRRGRHGVDVLSTHRPKPVSHGDAEFQPRSSWFWRCLFPPIVPDFMVLIPHRPLSHCGPTT